MVVVEVTVRCVVRLPLPLRHDRPVHEPAGGGGEGEVNCVNVGKWGKF